MAKDAGVSFGRLLGLLRDVGFETDEVHTPDQPKAPVRVCRDPVNDKHMFLFRERPITEPVREFELLTTRMHLDYWGYLAPEAFDEFVASAGRQPRAASRAKK